MIGNCEPRKKWKYINCILAGVMYESAINDDQNIRVNFAVDRSGLIHN